MTKLNIDASLIQSCVSVSVTESEIRIGNWFHHNVSMWSYRNDDGVISNDNDNFKWESLDWYALGECTLDLEAVEPITITKKWLKKLGFIYDENWHYQLGENPLTKDYLLDICWIDGEEFPFYRNGYFKIKYVHQLQNLYFALVGSELQISSITEH